MPVNFTKNDLKVYNYILELYKFEELQALNLYNSIFKTIPLKVQEKLLVKINKDIKQTETELLKLLKDNINLEGVMAITHRLMEMDTKYELLNKLQFLNLFKDVILSFKN